MIKKKIVFVIIVQNRKRLITASVLNTIKDISKLTFKDLSKEHLNLNVGKQVPNSWSAGELERNGVAVISLDQFLAINKKALEVDIQVKLKEIGEKFRLPYYKKFKL